MKVSFSIISVSAEGEQLTASGYRHFRDLFAHLCDRLNTRSTEYQTFVVVATVINDEGEIATTSDVMNREECYECAVRGLFKQFMPNAFAAADDLI